MPILVAGALRIKAGHRDAFVEQSQAAVRLARQHNQCLDFSVCADPIDNQRVNILEKWLDQAALTQFRHSGSDNNLFSLVESFDLMEYEVDH